MRYFYFLFAILLFEKNIHAEEYSCSYIFNGKAKSFILERNSSYFTFITPSNKEMFLTILGEDDDELILGGAFKTEGVDYYYVNYIDKLTLQYRIGSVPAPKHKIEVTNTQGKCIKK